MAKSRQQTEPADTMIWYEVWVAIGNTWQHHRTVKADTIDAENEAIMIGKSFVRAKVYRVSTEIVFRKDALTAE